ncbi:hypothetical protein EVAR_24644_1 [Eumeta japonica]|uniref:Uncharacterized protein n=1 Tax=Eumeta variegata TaxID=151549 RepID=A0A4C1V1R9_EUMVA|nr:hypothetical protein EVAR_24644_1 [Eumeta japonica]
MLALPRLWRRCRRRPCRAGKLAANCIASKINNDCLNSHTACSPLTEENEICLVMNFRDVIILLFRDVIILLSPSIFREAAQAPLWRRPHLASRAWQSRCINSLFRGTAISSSEIP